ncbi:hypothetical protein SAMN05216187_108128 [Jeotgalicoccus aerolatus]|uniref:Uncharacterized protein n=1 Tax=Jeotgalicoccus aerolatus TaxID=709510 RepID=A0A1G9BW15_9STAP|nr:hypothetical protein SAMN05216187_108128 [Jeotgalicoccus aerolatus]
MREFGWTINQVNQQPYEKLMELIIDKEKKTQDNTLMNGADFIKNL